MARKKKSRKIGQIGVRSVDKDQRKRKPSAPDKVKIGKGNKSGSRHSAPAEHQAQQQKVYKDPRVGSKKPIPLVVEKVQQVAQDNKQKKSAYFTPAQELAALENDDRLNLLLDKQDEGVKLSQDDQAYIDKCLARHKILCDLLGVNDEPEQPEEHDDDPMARLNAIDINKFK